MARAGLIYGLFAFGLGFVLGTVRTLLVAPAVGEALAVLLELPVMLAACWWCAGRIVARHRPQSRNAALAIGVIGLMVVLAGEFVVGIALMGQSPSAWLAGFARPTGQLGLIAQLLAAAMPLIRARQRP